MILIAESGSSKTDWRLLTEEGSVKMAKTAGFNPYHQDADQIYAEIASQLLPQLGTTAVDEIHFYGAGCSTETNCNIVKEGVSRLFSHAQVHVGHDLLAAARALSGHKAGIICIIGTGVNIGLYDGNDIIAGRPSLGFWLGDEGSGGYLGRTLIQHFFHEEMPAELHQAFEDTYHLNIETVLEYAYKRNFPSSYFASFSRFLSDHITHPYSQQLIYNGFVAFINRYVNKFANYQDYPIHFTGSIAFHYQDILRKVAQDKNIHIENIIDNPITGLIQFHQTVS
ncbi:N-acetylglucosamine kinase [Xanthocytophaga flava]|uniref:N-acetylglucosamine kinase n=1 Tax=Xanthocytophaga flava TaxID=3048013 RepID=UPI0028D8D2D5|nr:N-acetylglucosamine kinase [Xanthocytophaga flavus]MDJ1468798.1 N-acetylglucosamine kinase [Xanthocytophaga flavus]